MMLITNVWVLSALSIMSCVMTYKAMKKCSSKEVLVITGTSLLLVALVFILVFTGII